MKKARPISHAGRMSLAMGFPLTDSLRLLALGVISQAIDDRRTGFQDVEVAGDWARLAEVPFSWLTDAGLQVAA